MSFPEPGAQTKKQLDPFEFVDPVGEGSGEFVVGDGSAREGARRSEVSSRQRSISGERSIAEDRNHVEILAHEHHHRHSFASVDPKAACEVGLPITLDPTEIDVIRRVRDSFEHRSLLGAVTAPDTADREHRHAAGESRRQPSLALVQRHPSMNPSPGVRPFGVRREVGIETQAGIMKSGEGFRGEGMIHPRGSSEVSKARRPEVGNSDLRGRGHGSLESPARTRAGRGFQSPIIGEDHAPDPGGRDPASHEIPASTDFGLPRVLPDRTDEPTPPCPGDYDGSGAIDGGDLARILAFWNQKSEVYDLTGDGRIDGADLAMILANWGSCV